MWFSMRDMAETGHSFQNFFRIVHFFTESFQFSLYSWWFQISHIMHHKKEDFGKLPKAYVQELEKL